MNQTEIAGVQTENLKLFLEWFDSNYPDVDLSDKINAGAHGLARRAWEAALSSPETEKVVEA